MWTGPWIGLKTFRGMLDGRLSFLLVSFLSVSIPHTLTTSYVCTVCVCVFECMRWVVSVLLVWETRNTSQHSEVMAGLGTDLEGHLFVVLGHQPVKEAPGLLGDALLAAVDGAPALIGLLAVATQADLSHDALEELVHVVVQ